MKALTIPVQSEACPVHLNSAHASRHLHPGQASSQITLTYLAETRMQSHLACVRPQQHKLILNFKGDAALMATI